MSLQMNTKDGQIEGWDNFWNQMEAEGNISQEKK
jgi:hypothetical protein